MSYITEEEKDVSQIRGKQYQQQLINRQWERFINEITNYKRTLLKREHVICQQQLQSSNGDIHNQQTQLDKHQADDINKSTFKTVQFLNQQQTKKTNNTEHHNNRNKQWKYKQQPFKLSIEKFQTIIKLIITRDQQYKGDLLLNEGEQVEVRGDDEYVVEGARLGQKLKQEEQTNELDQQRQNNIAIDDEQTVFDQISNYGQNDNHNLSKQQKQQKTHSRNNKQQTTFNTFNNTKQQPHTKLNILQTLKPTIKHINPKTKYQLINQIQTIKNIQTIQFVIDIYNYINLFLWIKQQHFLHQSFLDSAVLFALMRRFQEITAIEVCWRDLDEGIDERQQQIQQQLLTIKEVKQIIKRKNKIIIIQHIRHKFYSQAFFRCLTNKKETGVKSNRNYNKTNNNNNKNNKIVKLFKHYCKFLTNHPNPHQFDTKFYIHYIHTQAYWRKYFLIANIINSKCFQCQTERFVSNSLYQVKIYQKMVKKINNFLYPQIGEF